MERRLSPQFVGIAVSGALLVLAVGALALFLVRDTSEGRFAGQEDVDAVIQGVTQHDLAALLERVRTHEAFCSTQPQPDPTTLLAPPLCPEGAPEGTPIEVFMTGTCEGTWTTSDLVINAFAERLPEAAHVYAVLYMGPDAQSFGPLLAQYRIVYGRPGEPEFPFSGHIALLDGDIVQLSTWCGNVLDQIVTLQTAGGEPVFISPELDLAISVRGE